MSIQLTRILVIVGLLIGTSAFAQDEPGPCDPPTDKKILKLLADAEKAKDAESRHHKLKEALENDAECATCLYELGMSAYRIGKESGKGYDAAIRYFD